MTHIVQFQDQEQITVDDLNEIGLSSRQTVDFLISDAIDDTLKFAGFPISQTSLSSVKVGDGRLYKSGQMHSNEDANGTAVNLAPYLPGTPGNTRIVSLVCYGQQNDSSSVPRTFLVDSSTGETEGRNIATRSLRATFVAPSPGNEAPAPTPPTVGGDLCEFARVLLGSGGIISISYVEKNRLKNITGLDSRITMLEAFEAAAGARIETLGSDIANLAASIAGLPNPAIFSQVVATLARVQNAAKVPASASNFHFDNLLTKDFSSSDTSVASYYARVQEGIRFPWAATQIAPLALFNPLEPKVKAGSQTGLLLPDYTESTRIDVMGNDGSLALTQYEFQNLEAVQKSISRQVVNFGPAQTVCVNSLWWHQGTYDPITGIFTRQGESYKVTDTFKSGYAGRTAHEIVRVEQMWTSTMTDTYTDYKINNLTVSGSIKAQTFLNSQAGWMTSIELAFSQLANASVTVLLTETSNGSPDATKVIGKSTIQASGLATYPATSKFNFTPVYLDAGSRYGIVVVSSGNHSICYVSGNKYAQGTLFDSTDSAGFFQGDLTRDLAMRVNFAKFSVASCQIQMKPLQLADGITDIELIYGTKVPDGCQIVWEFQKDGVWYAMQSYGTANPLYGLPPILPLRVTLVGTTDLMPGIDMTQTQTTCSRPAARFLHWTQPIAIGVPSSNIRVEVTVDAYEGASHDVGAILMIGSNQVNPSAVSTAGDPAGASAKKFVKTFTFSLGSATSSFRIGINGTTNAVTKVFHVESRYDYES